MNNRGIGIRISLPFIATVNTFYVYVYEFLTWKCGIFTYDIFPPMNILCYNSNLIINDIALVNLLH